MRRMNCCWREELKWRVRLDFIGMKGIKSPTQYGESSNGSHSRDTDRKRLKRACWSCIIVPRLGVTKLMGHDSTSVYKFLFAITIQLVSLHLLQDAPWYTRLFCCYTLSGCINHAMTLAMHEASHNLCAKKFWHNRVILILANLPMAIPSGASFRRLSHGTSQVSG